MKCETCQHEATVHIEAVKMHFCDFCLKQLDERLQRDIQTALIESAPSNYPAGGEFYNGIEWFACWLLDNAEGETVTEEMLRLWACKAWLEKRDNKKGN